MAEDLKDLAGIPLFPFDLEWQIKPKITLSPLYRDISFPGTRLETELHAPFLGKDLSLTVRFFSKQEERDILQFFREVKGRWGRFWIRSPHRNYTLHADLMTDQSVVDIHSNNFNLSYHGYERVYFDDGADVATRKITDYELFTGPDFCRLSFTDPIERDWLVADKRLHIGQLLLVRFTHDDLAFKYKTDHIGSTSLKVTELAFEYGEV